jgi:hypothetical protein
MMTTSEYEKTFVERIHDQGVSRAPTAATAADVFAD